VQILYNPSVQILYNPGEAKLLETYPVRLTAIITAKPAKGDSNMYLLRDISVFLSIHLQKLRSITVCVDG
jgi:hypothetical protein